MTTTKSYSSDSRFFPAYVSALRSQLPFAIVSGIIFIVLFIVVFFASTTGQYVPANAQRFFLTYFEQGIYTNMEQSVLTLAVLAFMTLASTLMGMSYLHKKNTVDLYHSLPVTRPQLLGANLLATLTAVLGPFIAIYLLTMIIQLVTCARYSCFGPDYFLFIFFDILSAIVYTAVIAVFVAFVAANVGTVFDAFSVSVITGFTPLVVYMISGFVWQSLLYGAYFEPSENSLFLSPFLFIYTRYMDLGEYSYPAGYYTAPNMFIRNYTGSVIVLIVGILLMAAFFALAVVCYRRRKSEIAEQTQPRGVLQIIVRLVAVFVGGAMFYAIFNDLGFIPQIIVTLIGAVGVGIISELILSRGVKFLGKNLKLLVGAGAVYCLLLVLVQFDVFGYTSRLPSPDSITGVKITYDGRFRETDSYPYRYRTDGGAFLTDPDSIAVVHETHNMVINNRPPELYSDDAFSHNNLYIEYKLKNGSTMKRTYSPVFNGAYRNLSNLEDNDDFIRANSALFWAEAYPDNSKVETVELYASFGRAGGQHANVLENPNLLLDAIRADMLDQSLDDILHPKEPALGFIKINMQEVEEKRGFDLIDGSYSGRSFSTASSVVAVTREYRRTIAVLKQLNLNGGFDDAPLNLDDVEDVVLAPVDGYYSYSNRVRTFSRQFYDSSDGRNEPYYRSRVDTNRNDTLTLTDPASIRAVAKASRDTVFADQSSWYENYTLAYFTMSDGSSATKAVLLSELPADIASERQKILAAAEKARKGTSNAM